MAEGSPRKAPPDLAAVLRTLRSDSTPDGRLEFKTDNQDLFAFSLDEIDNSDIWHLDAFTCDFHNDAAMNRGNIMTEYEEKFSSMGNPICKLIASR